MKKIAAIILALVISLACIACTDNDGDDTPSKTRPVVPTEKPVTDSSEPDETAPEASATIPTESTSEETTEETEPASETKKGGTIELPRDEF